MVEINDLDAVQARAIENIIDNQDENHWVKGFAGSGKTIVLTHVLKRLATARPPVKVCFATFTHALKDLIESGLTKTELDRIDISTFNGLGKMRNDYDLVVADEMQDIPSRVLPTLAKKSDVLVIAADLDQSIYRSACSVSELNAAIKPAKEHQLREIHRINENVFEIATSVYTDAKVVSQTTVRQDDEQARMYEGVSMRDEFVTMYEEAVRVSAKESPSAVLLPSKALLDKFISTIATANSYAGTPPSVKDSQRPEIGEQADPFKEINAYLKKNKSPLQVFGGGSGSLYDSDTKKMVYLMTYHSAKGLDFANVFLPHLTEDVSLEPMKGASDDQERRLFFVATTRARERLYLSYHDEPHRFIEEIPDYLLETFNKQKRNY
ncbi:MAG: AAA family ATPase [Bacteroidetes bacterium]|nr:AAA family ATPase [Bacteroidota bacterium]